MYDEKHAKDALGSKAMGSEYTSEGDVAPSSRDVLYDPAIPTERPEVSDIQGGMGWTQLKFT